MHDEPLEPWLAESLGIPTSSPRSDRDEQGRFAKGCKPGPGRPKGALDFGEIARAACEASGISLEEAAVQIWQSLFYSACVERDTAALRMLSDRIFGRVPKELRVELETPPPGPAFPPDFDPDAYAARLAELTRKDFSPAARARPAE